MTRSQRIWQALPVLTVYWILLAGGLLLLCASRPAEPAVVGLGIAALTGTLLGHCLALCNVRMSFAAVVIVAAIWLGAIALPSGFMWQAFVPAVLCACWSLGDRSVLAACWFPAVLWMLTILDRTDGKLAPDGLGVVLLGGFALLFLVMLRVRESRRIALWQTVAPVPLAAAKPPELLRELPKLELARTGWAVTIGAITVAITAWIAPHLWRLEPLRPDPVCRLTWQASAPLVHGQPCCPDDATRSRVKEYLDLGRGHDDEIAPRPGINCVVCLPPTVAAWNRASGMRRYPDTTAIGGAGPVVTRPADPWARRVSVSDPSGLIVATPTPAPGPGFAATPAAPAAPAPPAAPQPAAPIAAVQQTATPAPATTRIATPTTPRAATPTVPRPATPTASAPVPSNTRANPSLPPSSASGAPVLSWVIALAAGAVIFQLVGFAVRPLRRILTLRHLRRPLWAETVDQRISNSWQLALVGLRDAGWRVGATEPPQALARRVGVDGLERCATILERTRHGLGIDADDLAVMSESADAAYRAARTGLGAVARTVGWLRWPLT